MHFKIGEKVSFLKEVGHGIVLSIESDNKIKIEDETGFERILPVSDIVKIHGDQSESIDKGAYEYLANEELGKSNFKNSNKRVTKSNENWEIDLHTHELLETEAGMSSTELLRYQMSCFRSFYREATNKNIKKLIVIHGVGQGVLKHEVRSFLNGQDGVEYFDADFRTYGKGATEIRIYNH